MAEICDGCEFNYFRLIANFFENYNHSITVLHQHGVLPNSVKCPKCNKVCLGKISGSGGVPVRSKPKKHKSRKSCSYNISDRKGSSMTYKGVWGRSPRFG